MKKFQTRLLLEMILLTIVVLTVLGFFLSAIISSKVPSSVRVGVMKDVILVIIICAVGVSIGIVYFIRRTTTQFINPIEGVIHVATELNNGNYRARAFDKNVNDTSHLGRSINQLAKTLLELKISNDIQKDRMQTLIEYIGSGLVLVDDKGYISHMNESFRNKYHPDPVMTKPYYQVIKQSEIIELTEKVFRTEKRATAEMDYEVEGVMKTYHIVGEPISGDQNVWKGVLVILHDISELKKFEVMRREFVANVSHELKTPVTSLKGFAETLLDGAKDDPVAMTNFLKIILAESERLQELIDDLLELSKIENGHFPLEKEPVSIVKVIEECCSIIEIKAQERNIHLQFNHNHDDVSIQGDSLRLKQVFINLLSNAIAYTQPDGSVEIELADQGDQIIVAVKDSGIGIEKTHFPRIFERFYRVDKGRSRSVGGTGLGLAIVKHIVEAHQGSVVVDSEVGRGTTFVVTLPK